MIRGFLAGRLPAGIGTLPRSLRTRAAAGGFSHTASGPDTDAHAWISICVDIGHLWMSLCVDIGHPCMHACRCCPTRLGGGKLPREALPDGPCRRAGQSRRRPPAATRAAHLAADEVVAVCDLAAHKVAADPRRLDPAAAAAAAAAARPAPAAPAAAGAVPPRSAPRRRRGAVRSTCVVRSVTVRVRAAGPGARGAPSESEQVRLQSDAPTHTPQTAFARGTSAARQHETPPTSYAAWPINLRQLLLVTSPAVCERHPALSH